MGNWQNWMVGDEPENCIPIGEDTAKSHGTDCALVRARTAEEAARKGIAAYNKRSKKARAAIEAAGRASTKRKKLIEEYIRALDSGDRELLDRTFTALMDYVNRDI